MMQNRSYRIALIIAITLHLFVVALLLSDQHNQRPVLTMEAKNEAGQQQAMPLDKPQEQPIQAVSVDSQEVKNTISRLKNERLLQKQAEERRQSQLKQQAELARKQRIQEQQQLEKIKNEAAKLAIVRKKQLADEQEHLKQVLKQKEEQEKHLADLKHQQLAMEKQQQQKAIKMAEDAKKKAAELALNAEKAKADLIKKQQAAAQQAKLEAATAARISGEVDKYKALIINAISSRWILPQNVDGNMSCQFRIRLAPNGSVLEVSLMRSSGDPILDRSALSAIYKASPLPVPSDPGAFNMFRDISLTVRPVNAMG